jgi:hypothetical protein
MSVILFFHGAWIQILTKTTVKTDKTSLIWFLQFSKNWLVTIKNQILRNKKTKTEKIKR